MKKTVSLSHPLFRLASSFLLLLAAACARQTAPEQKVELDVDAISSALLQLPGNRSNPTTLSPDTPMLQVNEKVFTLRDLNLQAARLLQASGRQWTAAEMQQIRPALQQEAEQALVTSYLMAGEARRRGIDAPISAVQEQISKIEAALPEGKNLEDALELQGLTRADLFNELREQIRIQNFQQALAEAVPPPTPEELKTYYTENPAQFTKPEQRRIRHLFKAFTPDMTPAERTNLVAKVDTLRATLLKEGSDFAAVIRRQSDAPDKDRNGETIINRDPRREQFQRHFFDLPVNSFSETIVDPREGAHLIQVLEILPERLLEFDEVKEQLYQGTLRQRQAQAIGGELDRLLRAAEIKPLMKRPGSGTNTVDAATPPTVD